MRTYLLGFSMVVVSVAACTSDTRVTPDDLATATEHVYRIASIELPATSGEVGEVGKVGVDIDGDGVVDNQLGRADAVLHSQSPAFDLELAMNGRLADDPAWLVHVWQDRDGH